MNKFVFTNVYLPSQGLHVFKNSPDATTESLFSQCLKQTDPPIEHTDYLKVEHKQALGERQEEMCRVNSAANWLTEAWPSDVCAKAPSCCFSLSGFYRGEPR